MPTQTPASRRFVLPSSTAPAHSQKHHGFASQFTRSSNAPSSPFIRTPFSSTARKQRRDDIVADDSQEDDPDDHDDHHEPSHGPHEPVTRHTADPLAELTDDDDLLDSVQNPGLTIASQASLLQKSQASQFRTVKRRKISHPTTENVDDGLDLPSPPSSPTRDHNEDRSTWAQVHVPDSSPPPPDHDDPSPGPPQHRSSSPHSSSPPTSPAHDFQTPKHHKSRFRNPLAGFTSSTPALTFSATPQQAAAFPSFQSRLLASTSTPAPTSTSPGPHLRGPRPTLDLTLPDAFSPSRKRGAREYIYGGVAETVRGWVVDMATMIAGHTTTPAKSTLQPTSALKSTEDERDVHPESTALTEKPPATSKRKVVVKEVLMVDNNGRFVLIRSQPQPPSENENDDGAMQHEGVIWMLINTDPQSRKTSTSSRADAHSRLMAVQPGKIVNIRGGDTMTWDLNMDLNFDMHSAVVVDAAAKTKPTTCKVAVLWDVT